jgi:RNA polymerase sigma-70 factor, ECF subfamily
MAADQGDASDEMLMIRYQRGDRQAFAVLLRRHNRRLYNFALRQVRDPGQAEDIVQDAFLRVVQNASAFKHEARFSTWLYAIARNLCVDQLRKNTHRQHGSLHPSKRPGTEPTEDRVADPHPRSDAERSAASSEMLVSILRAVDGLPDEQREVFLLREIGQLRFSDIAQVTGAAENTVKSRMRYALERLREALSSFEDYARALR